MEFELGLVEAKVSLLTTAQHGLTREFLPQVAWLEASQSSPRTCSAIPSV